MNHVATASRHRDSSLGWAWLLAVPPLLAVLGGAITLTLALTHPDKVIATEKVSTVRQGDRTQVHVTNSVTPPLK